MEKQILKLKDLSFAAKLLASYVLLLVFIAIVGLIGYKSMHTIVFQAEIASSVEEMLSELSSARLSQADFMITGEPNFIVSNQELIAEIMGDGGALKKTMEVQASRDQVGDIEGRVKTYENHFNSYIELEEKQAAAFEACVAAEQRVMNEIRDVIQSIDTFFSANQHLFEEFSRYKAASRIENDFLWVLVLFNRYTESTNMKDIDEADQILRAMKDSIPQLKDRMLAQETKDALDKTLAAVEDYGKGMHDYASTIVAQNKASQAMLKSAGEANDAALKLLIAEKAIATKAEQGGIRMIIIFSVAAIMLTLILAFFITRSITLPLKAAVVMAEKVAEGDLTQHSEIDQNDEVGTLIRSLNIMAANLKRMFTDINTGVETLTAAATELSSISEQMTQSTQNVSDKSNTVSAAAEEMSANMNNVAAAMEQSATNTNMVATASEEMSATIDEIARNAEKAKGISDEAESKASTASSNMDQLGAAANSIGKVIETITDISEQVNLLALNATIEAARAGEAGKGFAVVANEIKDLAKQTAEATGDIKEKIEGIQGTTITTVGQISEINEVIKEVNGVVTNIASSVEEQSAATKEIATNVAQASQGIQEVNENVNQSSTVSGEISSDIAGVSVSMNEMSTSSAQVNLSAQELSKLSESLKQMVDQFKI